MIQGIHHIAIIVSSVKSLDFYSKLGFAETGRIDRGYDQIVFMSGYGETLELLIDPTHPKRVDRPEAMGLRHLALKVDDIDSILNLSDCEPVRIDRGARFTFTKDPDGLPIEFHE